MKKLTIVATFNMAEIAPFIVREAGRHGHQISVCIEDYHKFPKDDKFESDVYILALDLKDMFPEYYSALYPMHCSEIEYRCNALIEKMADFAGRVSKSGGKIIINNFNYPLNLVSGIYDFQNPSGQLIWIEYLNKKLSELPEAIANTFIFNMQFYVYSYGALRALDLKRYCTSKILFTEDFHKYLADKYAEFIRAMFGVRRKCLAVDLDNTLWGGIIGEDGMEGIHLGEQYPGNLYRDIQSQINQYADQGIILAVCSKNNEEDAMEVFKNHPGMVLKYEDFAAKRINWKDKAINLRSIADELNIGLDSMIFVDDDPFEIEMVRQKLPEVETIQLTQDPLANLHLVQHIASLNYLVYVEEDIKRRAYYNQKNAIDNYRQEFSTMDDFYKSLKITAEICLCDKSSMNRIAQLTRKTNQFNLTTRRYTEFDIAAIMASKRHRVYSMRVGDRFGDNGVTGVAILKMNENSWEIDSFLLSCRVIGRTVERALLAVIQEDAMHSGANEIIGYYLPTARNGLVKDFYNDNGFKKAGERWILNNSEHRIKVPEWILVK